MDPPWEKIPLSYKVTELKRVSFADIRTALAVLQQAFEESRIGEAQVLLDLLKRIFEASYYDLGDGVIRFPEDFFDLTPAEGKALFGLLGHFRSADDGRRL